MNVDEHGTYSGRLAFPHRWHVLASAPEYFPDSMEVEVAEETLYFVDFTLSPAVVEIVGRVTDSGTAPLPQAHVMVTELESGEVLFSGVTDSSGIYRVQSQVGRQLLITATKPGYTFGMLEIDELEPNTVPADIVLGLTAEGFVSEFRFLFEFNSDRLDTADISTQTQLAGCVDFVIRELLKSPTRRVRLVGWTDNIGSAEYNQSLSQRRADYIKDYLVRREIAAERIVAEGRGISDKYNNETEAGRARNRRTDVIFFDLQEVSERLGEKR